MQRPGIFTKSTILLLSSMRRIFDFRAGFLGRSVTFPYIWTHIFTKLVCLLILIYQHARCDHKLWNAFWFYFVFCEFSHNKRIFMSEVVYTAGHKKSDAWNLKGYFTYKNVTNTTFYGFYSKNYAFSMPKKSANLLEIQPKLL